MPITVANEEVVVVVTEEPTTYAVTVAADVVASVEVEGEIVVTTPSESVLVNVDAPGPAGPAGTSGTTLDGGDAAEDFGE